MILFFVYLNKVFYMLTNQLIDDLITEQKIVSVPPKRDFKEDSIQSRNDFELTSSDGTKHFSVFIRIHNEFRENFSIGLIYYPSESPSIMLFRCNGNHGEVVENPLKPIPHFTYHTHKMTIEDYERGLNMDPKFSEITKEYASYEQALSYFCRKVNITDASDYFPNINQLDLFI